MSRAAKVPFAAQMLTAKRLGLAQKWKDVVS